MNGTDPQIEQQASVSQSAFPTWPPPSGGYPNVTPELGPILNPFPYGSTQTANISTAPPSPPAGWPIPWGPLKGTSYPQRMPVGANGQNQPQQGSMPPYPHNKFTTLPDKAPPSLSQIP